jgi:hypothetical protein
MTTPAGAEVLDVRTRRWQISLADLIMLVLAVGVSAGIARGARDAVGNRVFPGRASTVGATTPTRSAPVPWERTAGLVFEVAAVFVIMVQSRTIVGLLRFGGRGEAVRTAACIWSIAWRVAAVAFLLGFVADQSGVLKLDFASEMENAAARPGWGVNYRLRQGLLPVCGALALVGLALGTGAGAIFDEPVTRRRRPSWLLVPLVGLIAVLLVMESDYSLIAYLVLLALEAVSNAMPLVGPATPGLTARLVGGGLDAIVAFLCCTALGVIVASDFERARRDELWATTRSGRLLRLLVLLATIGAGTYLARVTIPRMHPSMSQGFLEVLSPGVLFMTLAGFGLFALGLAARAVAPCPSRWQPAWLIWVSRLLRYGLMVMLFLSAMKGLPASTQLEPTILPSVGWVLDVAGQAQSWAWGLLPYPVVVVMVYCLEPDQLRWIIAVVFVSSLVIELVMRRPSAEEAPFDGAFGTTRSAIQLTWLTLGLMVVCLVALPALTVAGLVGLHIRVNLVDWMTHGWPS